MYYKLIIPTVDTYRDDNKSDLTNPNQIGGRFFIQEDKIVSPHCNLIEL